MFLTTIHHSLSFQYNYHEQYKKMNYATNMSNKSNERITGSKSDTNNLNNANNTMWNAKSNISNTSITKKADAAREPQLSPT